MLKVDTITKDWREAGSFPAQLNLYGFWDDHCFLTKTGDVGSVLKIEGIDYESLDHSGRDYAVKRLEAALRSLDDKTRLYQILFKRNQPEIPHAEYENPMVRAAVEQRTAFLKSKSDRLYNIEIFWVVMIDGSYRKTLYSGKARPLENDLQYIRDKGLVETQQVNLRRDGRRRTIERVEVVTLTREGRSLLVKQGALPQDQKVYAGLVKPREVEHDSQIYRAYRKEAERIEKNGGSNLRVKLDFEIKSQVQKAIYAKRKADPKRDMAEVRQQVAERFELPFVDGKIQIPDARIDYDLPREANQDIDQGSRTGHEDIEVLTAAYHAGHLRSKAQAGFRNYASSSDRATLTAKIEDDSHLMENILEL